MSESKHTPDIWGDAVRDFLAQYDNRRGRGGFPTAMDRAAIKRVLEQRSWLLEALREIEDALSNMGRDADHDALAEQARAAIAKAEGR